MKKELIFLIGPTAIGKTGVSLLLAKGLNAEIISCDSMQVYRGMDIITSKPSSLLQRRIPHHMIDIVSPTREYNVSQYRRRALRKINEIVKRRKVPLFVGGTGLYMSILMDGIFKAKTEDKRLRQHLYEQAQVLGKSALYEKLKHVDPLAASKIHPHDTKRIIRALEVFAVTGKPISQLQKQRKGLIGTFKVKIFCLTMERQRLYQRIDERLDVMFRQGLLAEARSLLKKKLSKTASCAIGIKELRGYLKGQYDLEEAKRLIKLHTRQYAKRQLAWFRKDKRIRWIEVTEKDSPKTIVKRIVGQLNRDS